MNLIINLKMRNNFFLTSITRIINNFLIVVLLVVSYFHLFGFMVLVIFNVYTSYVYSIKCDVNYTYFSDENAIIPRVALSFYFCNYSCTFYKNSTI